MSYPCHEQAESDSKLPNILHTPVSNGRLPEASWGLVLRQPVDDYTSDDQDSR